ncbi:MAG: hypothetical protein AAB316_06305 [Bacteroidota bacterium]
MKSTPFFLFLLACLPLASLAQPASEGGNQHRFYFFWGWNRAFFSKSDIHFQGVNHNFTLHNVVAKDRQSEFSFENYFHPSKITIPQTNYGIGYFFHDNYCVSLGIDHMKYVVEQGSRATITGSIENSGTAYDGNYVSEAIFIKNDLLKMEHTDGLNYFVAEFCRSDNLLKGVAALDRRLELNLVEGIGAGVLIPKSDVTLLSQPRNNQYHLSGYGFSAKAGLQLTFFRHFFLRGECKAGFLNLTSIKTSPDGTGKAKQHFWFWEPVFQFGGMFLVGK